MTSLSTQLRAAHALDELSAGSSQRQAAKMHRLDRSYLQRRIRGQRTREDANADQQILSPAQESFLVDWAIVQSRLGYAARITYFKHFAEQLLMANGTPQSLEKQWYYRFLNRNSGVRTLKSSLIDYKRANGASAENINIFFDRLDDPALESIPKENYHNADEFGLFQGAGDNGLRVGEAYRKQVMVKDAHNLQWITIIECTSASGSSCPPLVIFFGKHVQQQWFPNGTDTRWNSWYFTTSLTG
jgi:hypothetical protein